MNLSAGFASIADPLDAEMAAASIVASLDQLLDEDLDRLLDEDLEVTAAERRSEICDDLVAELEALADVDAASLLSLIGTIDQRWFGRSATAATRRLAAHGVTPHPVAAEASSPVDVTDCYQLCNADGDTLALAAGFVRSGRRHSFVILSEPEMPGQAGSIVLLPDDRIDQTVAAICEGSRRDGMPLVESRIPAGEFSDLAELALDMRAEEDAERLDPGGGGDADSEYAALARLLRTRLRSLPVSDRLQALFDRYIPPGAFRSGTDES